MTPIKRKHHLINQPASLPLGSPSPRKKRNNSTPSRKNTDEKKQILQQLISPSATATQRPKLSLGEIIQMADNNHLKPPVVADVLIDEKETSFFEAGSPSSSQTVLVPDPKLEKKVTFARLLSRVSAEISSSSEHDPTNGHTASAFNLSVELPMRASSVPPSPVTNDIRSPHSTSSNQGSDSLSGSDLTLPDFGGKHRRNRLKVSSADSILAMFRNYTSTTQSFVMSPTNTPTISSPQEDLGNDDEDSISSMHTPHSHSFSSTAPDSPVYFRQGNAIEVPVLDALSAHKTNTAQSHLHPPTILLEIPSGNNAINKCLSPIRELPSPMPSPALTPIMPRPQRTRSPSPQMCNSGSDEENSRVEVRNMDEEEWIHRDSF